MKLGVGYVQSVSITTNLHDMKRDKSGLNINFKATHMVDVKLANGRMIRTTVDNLVHEDKLPEMAKLLFT